MEPNFIKQGQIYLAITSLYWLPYLNWTLKRKKNINQFMKHSFTNCLFLFICIVTSGSALSQDKNGQYPDFLSRSYFGVNLGYINYPFSNLHLKQGYQVETVTIPHLAVRITLLGYRINKNLEALITYMRPVLWVQYKNINGDLSHHSVFMNVAGLTMKSSVPLNSKVSIFGEAGLGIITRNGFNIDNNIAVDDATFGTAFTGAGLEFKLNDKWSFVSMASYSPGNSKVNQPHVFSATTGFKYNMRPLPDKTVEKNSGTKYFFPKSTVQLSLSTHTSGYEVNNVISEKMHIFWGGVVQISHGLSINYLKNVFHVYKVFALDIGASAGYFKTNLNREEMATLSAFPVFRFNLLRTNKVDGYLYYSVAGPSYISKTKLDETEIGRRFTFRDFMGVGLYAGRKRKINFETSIGHFSNGNLFPNNSGVKIPLTFTLGYTR